LQEYKNILLEAGREKQKETLKQFSENTVLSTMDKTDESIHNTQKEIAERIELS